MLLRPSLRSNIEVIIETAGNLWHVDADAGALELSLLNLAFNARDAMKDGGTLRISATNQVLDGNLEGLRGEHVALRIADTGTGMSRETMDRVFEPFFTTKAFGEGTGLGLSQVFGFAKQLGGAVTVESAEGEGAAFTIYLPASHAVPTADIQYADGVQAPGAC
jgi:signal transduction histidine kinase